MSRVLAVLFLVGGLLTCGPTAAQEVERRRGFSVKVTAPADQDVVIGKALICLCASDPTPKGTLPSFIVGHHEGPHYYCAATVP